MRPSLARTAKVNGLRRPRAQMAHFRSPAVVQNGLSLGMLPSSLKRRILPKRRRSGLQRRSLPTGVVAHSHIQLAVVAEVQWRRRCGSLRSPTEGKLAICTSPLAVLPLTVKRLMRLCVPPSRGGVVDVDETVAGESGMRRDTDQTSFARRIDGNRSASCRSRVPLLCSTRNVPVCCATSRRPSGSWVNAVAGDSPVASGVRVKPLAHHTRTAEAHRARDPRRLIARVVSGTHAQHVLAGRIRVRVHRCAVGGRGGVRDHDTVDLELHVGHTACVGGRCHDLQRPGEAIGQLGRRGDVNRWRLRVASRRC